MPIIQPTTGAVGSQAVISATGLIDTSRDDDFEGPDLSTLWSFVSSGTAGLSVDHGATISCGPAANSLSGILSSDTYVAGDVSIDFEILPHFTRDKPTSIVDYAVLEFKIDSNNVWRIHRRYDPSGGGHVFAISLVVNSVVFTGATATATYMFGRLRIIKNGNTCVLLAGDGNDGWYIIYNGVVPSSVAPATVSIYTANYSSSDATTVRISSYRSMANVLLGTVPAIDTSVTKYGIVLTIPDQHTVLGPVLNTPGHLLDTNTLALWRFDDTAVGTSKDDVGKYSLTASGTPPAIVTGQVGSGRQFTHDASKYLQHLTNAGDSEAIAAQNALYGDFTIETWIYLDPAFAAVGIIMVYMGTAVGSDYNALIQFFVQAARHLEIYYEHDAQISVSPTASTALVPLATWTHIAVRKTVVAGNVTVAFFVNGVPAGTSSGWANSDHGESGFFCVGTASILGLAPFNGIIDEIRVSKIGRSDAEIMQSYKNGLPSISLFNHAGTIDTVDNIFTYVPAYAATLANDTKLGSLELLNDRVI